MEIIGSIASFAGVVSLGIQIAQILQRHISTVAEADDRVLQMAIELHATATSLRTLQLFVQYDKDAEEDTVINAECRQNMDVIIQRCNVVFRKIAVLLAKAGKAVLSVIDGFQDRVSKSPVSQLSEWIPDSSLTFELNRLEHLMWPWRAPRIEQSIADLDRLKLSLLLILAVIDLARDTAKKSLSAKPSQPVRG